MKSTAPLMVPVGTPRRVFVIAAVLGGIGLLIASLLGHVVVGVLLLVGVVLGATNNVLTALATTVPVLKEFRRA
jgi:hypothetical protein